MIFAQEAGLSPPQTHTQGYMPLTFDPSLQAGYLGVAYNQTLTVSGGTSPYTFALLSGSLSGTGLSLNTTSGAISGTPTEVAAIPLIVQVSDAIGSKAAEDLTLYIYSSASQATINSPRRGNLWVMGPVQSGCWRRKR
jgi:hypothetical protein